MNSNELPWLAAYTRPKHEDKVRQHCLRIGVEVFLPSYKSWRRWSDRRKLIELPLFPSYVFMRMTEDQRLRAVQAPGFLWLVHDRVGPTVVASQELDSIRCLLASGMEFDPLPRVGLDDEVEIVRGALRGCRGRLLRKDPTAIVLAVTAIGAAIKVTLPDPSWVVPVANRYRVVPAVACRWKAPEGVLS